MQLQTCLHSSLHMLLRYTDLSAYFPQAMRPDVRGSPAIQWVLKLQVGSWGVLLC